VDWLSKQLVMNWVMAAREIRIKMGTHTAQAWRLAVVDDDPAVHRRVAEQLQESGECWQVTAYHSGEDALTGVAACPPHAVLIDIGMPWMTGIEFVHQLKAELARVADGDLCRKGLPGPSEGSDAGWGDGIRSDEGQWSGTGVALAQGNCGTICLVRGWRTAAAQAVCGNRS
jgi:hypothetical protein